MRQSIVHAPESQQTLARGVEQLARVLSLTLGPSRGRVAIGGASRPEVLDGAGVLSLRSLSFSDSLDNVGHQCLRGALAALDERTGDGVATCAVLTQAILAQTAPLLAFGHHPVNVQRDIRVAHTHTRDILRQRAWPIDNPDDAARVLQTANLPADIAALVAEIVDTIGPEGALIVEETRQVGIASEYIRGGRWNKGVASPAFLGQEPNQVIVRSPAILASDHPVKAAADAVAILEAAAGARELLVIAPEFSDVAVSLLLANRGNGGFGSIIAVKAPVSIQSGSGQLEDIAVMTGGRFLPRDAGTIRAVSPGDLGHAERAWASRSAFGIIGGAGETRAINQRVASLRAQARSEQDPVRRTHLSVRAGNLAGLSALVRVGTGPPDGPTTRQIERAAAIARAAFASGVVEGGGAALARAGQRVAREFRGTEYEVGAMALARALTAPMAVIVAPTGRAPGPLLDRLGTCEGVFDVTTGAWVDARATGLVDALAVVEGALDVAVSTALMLLSTDVMIGKRRG